MITCCKWYLGPAYSAIISVACMHDNSMICLPDNNNLKMFATALLCSGDTGWVCDPIACVHDGALCACPLDITRQDALRTTYVPLACLHDQRVPYVSTSNMPGAATAVTHVSAGVCCMPFRERDSCLPYCTTLESAAALSSSWLSSMRGQSCLP